MFALRSSLIQHQQLHLGAKTHVCKICGKTFSRKFSLENPRRRIYLGELPYKCEFWEGYLEWKNSITNLVKAPSVAFNQHLQYHLILKNSDQPSVIKTSKDISAESEKVPKYVCDACHRTFQFRRYYLKSLQVHKKTFCTNVSNVQPPPFQRFS
ncbi:hypothetical protein TNCT_269861 [Trichonephila clavata]|uniref:C2H2-type domain-containing protein n=1 Tax=Trichonephila clavata TaxID=2740835 RepID=A0A8X6FHZ9_TRICU|nr:hypothetical protein TNCT_269861 [Trichonephila clavata]